MNDNQITAVIIAMLNNRYLIPGKDNERTAKEIVKIYKVLKEKTYDEDNDNDDEASKILLNPPI
jgi:hypothetical protein